MECSTDTKLKMFPRTVFPPGHDFKGYNNMLIVYEDGADDIADGIVSNHKTC